MLRFSDAEFEVVRGRAELAGSAVGAWLGEVAVETARGGQAGVGLPDLLRLHADVVLVGRFAVGSADGERVAGMLDRLDAAIDVVVAAVGSAP